MIANVITKTTTIQRVDTEQIASMYPDIRAQAKSEEEFLDLLLDNDSYLAGALVDEYEETDWNRVSGTSQT